MARDPASAVCDSSRGLVATLTACFTVFFGRMGHVANEPESMTRLEHLGPEWGESPVRNGSRLKVANVVGGVVHELDMTDAALMGLLKTLKLGFEKIESFHITHDRGLSGPMGRLEIGRRKRSAQAVRGDHLVHPIEPLEMVLVESARFRCPHGGEYAGLIPGKNGSVRYVRKAGDRQGSRPHRLREIIAGRRR
jgi:hypothetical protein